MEGTLLLTTTAMWRSVHHQSGLEYFSSHETDTSGTLMVDISYFKCNVLIIL